MNAVYVCIPNDVNVDRKKLHHSLEKNTIPPNIPGATAAVYYNIQPWPGGVRSTWTADNYVHSVNKLGLSIPENAVDGQMYVITNTGDDHTGVWIIGDDLVSKFIRERFSYIIS